MFFFYVILNLILSDECALYKNHIAPTIELIFLNTFPKKKTHAHIKRFYVLRFLYVPKNYNRIRIFLVLQYTLA